MNETNKKMSFEMGVKFAAPLYMGKICTKSEVKKNQSDMRYN